LRTGLEEVFAQGVVTIPIGQSHRNFSECHLMAATLRQDMRVIVASGRLIRLENQ
jgi:hypothetical protein